MRIVLIYAKTVLDLAKRAKKIFFKFEIKGKTTTFKFSLLELKIRWKKGLVTLQEPFSTLIEVSNQPKELQLLVTLRTFPWLNLKENFKKSFFFY